MKEFNVVLCMIKSHNAMIPKGNEQKKKCMNKKSKELLMVFVLFNKLGFEHKSAFLGFFIYLITCVLDY